MCRFAQYIIIGLVLALTLPLGAIEHVLTERSQSMTQVTDCGCPSEENQHSDDTSSGDCDSECHCACHVTLHAALIQHELSSIVISISIPENGDYFLPSPSPKLLDRPPITVA